MNGIDNDMGLGFFLVTLFILMIYLLGRIMESLNKMFYMTSDIRMNFRRMNKQYRRNRRKLIFAYFRAFREAWTMQRE